MILVYGVIHLPDLLPCNPDVKNKYSAPNLQKKSLDKPTSILIQASCKIWVCHRHVTTICFFFLSDPTWVAIKVCDTNTRKNIEAWSM